MNKFKKQASSVGTQDMLNKKKNYKKNKKSKKKKINPKKSKNLQKMILDIINKAILKTF